MTAALAAHQLARFTKMPVPPGASKARKPTTLKILGGTFRRGLSNAAEPKLAPLIPTAPERLDAEEQAAWRYYSEILEPMRVVTKVDAIAFERLVCCHVEVMRAQAVIRKDAAPLGDGTPGDTDPTYESKGKDGNVMRRVKPIFAALSEAERRLRDWLGRFGLTPADRGRVNAGHDGKGKKKGAEFAS